MRFQLLVFDWDGTLSDSLSQIVESLQDMITVLQLEQRSVEELRNIIGLGLDEGMSLLYPDLTASQRVKLTQSYHHHYRATSIQTGARLYDGVRETIQLLHRQGYFLAVATGKSRSGLQRSLEETGLKRYFHTTCCADEAFSKPHPQMLEEIMHELAISPGQTLMIGDSEYDLLMAANAGVYAAAVNYGVHDVQRLLEFKPLKCFDNLEDLPGWLSIT